MSKVHIFIETTTNKNSKDTATNEERFIRHIVNLLHPEIEKIEISGTGGYTNLVVHQNTMQRNTADGGKNLVVFDADFAATNGGLEKRREELLNKKKELDVDFELFLFPNNQEDGTFEHLLEHLTTEKHKGLLECFEGYEMCIGGKNNKAYVTPDQKAKMYAYISALRKTQKETAAFKNGDWFFDRTELWNFDAEYLKPLKEFLSTYLNNN